MEATPAPEHGASRPSLILPSIQRFLEALPEIQLKVLSEDHKNCSICMEQYTDDVKAEYPVSLRCGHVFGSLCIKSWVSSSQVSQPTCPICRATLTPSSDIQRWEHLATIMQQQPYISLHQTPRRRITSSLEGDVSAVELVSLFFQVVMEMLAHHHRHRIPASVLLLQSAKAVASRMGDLYVLLRPTTDVMGVTALWDERGPEVVTVLDLKRRRMFEGALEKLAQVERRTFPSKRSVFDGGESLGLRLW